MIGVSGRVVCLPISVTESRVVSIRAFLTHIFLHALPFLDGESVLVVALIVPLRSTERSKRQLVIVVETLSDAGKPVVTFEIRTLDVSVAPGLTTQQRECPAIFGQTRRYAEKDFIVTVVTHAVRYESASLGFRTLCYDVNRTAHCRNRYFGSTQTALYLHATGYIGQSGPVGPVHLLILHTVHRHTVNHHSHVLTLETADTCLGITITTTVFSGIDTRSGFQNFGKLLRTEFFFNEHRVYGRYRYRSFTSHCNGRCNRHIRQHHCIRLHLDGPQLYGSAFLCNLFLLVFITDVFEK